METRRPPGGAEIRRKIARKIAGVTAAARFGRGSRLIPLLLIVPVNATPLQVARKIRHAFLGNGCIVEM
jgi:hypothetical protein